MWEAIKYVGSGLTLAAFLAAVAAWVFKNKINEKERLIRSAPAEDRSKLVMTTLEFFSVDARGLTQDQQYGLALRQIRARASRFQMAAGVVIAIAVLAAAVTTFALWRESVAPSPPTSKTSIPAELPPAGSGTQAADKNVDRPSPPPPEVGLPPKLSVKMSLRDDLCSWYAADKEVLDRHPFVDQKLDAYYGGSYAEAIVPGLWIGDIFAGFEPLARSQVQRSLLRVIPRIVEAREKYLASNKRTASLDSAWKVFPDDRSMTKDLEAFHSFARILYPPDVLTQPAVLKRRDELIESLRDFWILPEAVMERTYPQGTELRLFYDLLLWRTTPIFSLRITNASLLKQAIDKVELRTEDYRPFKDTMVSGPIQTLATARFKLLGATSTNLSASVNVGIAPGDVGDILVFVESPKKAYYKVRLALTSAGSTVWESEPFSLFFLY